MEKFNKGLDRTGGIDNFDKLKEFYEKIGSTVKLALGLLAVSLTVGTKVQAQPQDSRIDFIRNHPTIPFGWSNERETDFSDRVRWFQEYMKSEEYLDLLIKEILHLRNINTNNLTNLQNQQLGQVFPNVNFDNLTPNEQYVILKQAKRIQEQRIANISSAISDSFDDQNFSFNELILDLYEEQSTNFVTQIIRKTSKEENVPIVMRMLTELRYLLYTNGIYYSDGRDAGLLSRSLKDLPPRIQEILRELEKYGINSGDLNWFMDNIAGTGDVFMPDFYRAAEDAENIKQTG